MQRGGTSHASRESTDQLQEANAANSIRRYLTRKGYDLSEISNESILKRLLTSYSGNQITQHGDTRNERMRKNESARPPTP